MGNRRRSVFAATGETKGARTRDAIADTAISILRQSGFQALSVAALADGAGIRRNSYYTHFEDLSTLINALSNQVLDDIGRRSVVASALRPSSVLRLRMQYVLSLPVTDEAAATVVSELYVHHAGTAREVHRRLALDMAADRRRGLLSLTHRESKMAAIVIASGAMELLRTRHQNKRGEARQFLRLMARICGLLETSGASNDP